MKEVRFSWGPNVLLSDAVVLREYDGVRPYRLFTDANNLIPRLLSEEPLEFVCEAAEDQATFALEALEAEATRVRLKFRCTITDCRIVPPVPRADSL